MASEAPVYDLILLLDTTTEQERRDTILANVEDVIDAAASSSAATTGATAPPSYEVRKHAEADYHLIQFHGPTALLEQLDHSLKITDGVLRFRIIKLRPGTPAPPDLARGHGRRRAGAHAESRADRPSPRASRAAPRRRHDFASRANSLRRNRPNLRHRGR